MFKQAVVIARKEIVDHLREKRSMASSLLHLLIGPLVVLLVLVSVQKGLGSKKATSLTGVTSMTSVFALVAVFTGGMNVAIDLMAGERERRSLLPLLLMPVTKLTVVVGKWLATSVFSVLGLTVTLLALAAVLRATGTSNPLFSRLGLFSWAALGLFPLAFLASALEVAISTVCRTTKEANTYLPLVIFIPMIISMYFVFFPYHVGAWTFLVPVAGQQAIAEQGIRTGHWPFVQMPVLLLMTVWLTALIIRVTGRMLNRDEVVYG